jgi:FkbM family methyltransferase
MLTALGCLDRELGADELLDVTRRRTGLEDFGPDDFLEPFRLLVGCYNTEAQLNFIGRMSARTYLLQLLENRLRLEQDRRQHPEIAAQEITAPVFILGLPRTGSTLLFELMAQNPALRVPMSWEVMLPSPPPRADTFDNDPRIRTAQRMFDWVDRIAPDFKHIHAVGALFGYFSLLPAAARPGLEVRTFEMNPESFRCIQLNVARNPELAPAIHPVHAALSGETKLGATIWYSGMLLRDAPGEGFREAVFDVLSLDYIAEQLHWVPDLLKIDVEGFEAPVLRGGERLLRSRQPALLYELHKDQMLERHGATRKSVTRSLFDFGYQIFALDQHREKSVSARPLQSVRSVDHHLIELQRSHAFVALPPALVPRLDGLVRR